MANNELTITLRLKNETEAAIKEAESNISSLQQTVKNSVGFISENLQAGGLAATGFIASIGAMGKSMIGVSSNMEQAKVSFTTMIGDIDKAGKLLKQISEEAVKTPFELPQLVEGAKRLLAYNVEADKIIPTLRMLGNIAAGVGTEKLPQLILAFGQVKAATKLTGAELRQFSEAGVPLLEALVNKANETGGVLTKMGGASSKAGKEAAKLSAKLVDMQYNMDLLTKYGKNHGMQWEKLQHNYQETQQKLQSFGSAGQEVYAKVKVSAKDMIEQISDGKVGFDQMQDALMGMTDANGRFFNLMEKQSHTFGGVLSNISDSFVRFSLQVMGFGDDAEIRKGSIFYYLKQGAELLYNSIEMVRPVVAKFIDGLVQNQTAVMAIAGAIAGLFILIAAAFIQFAGAGILVATIFAAVGAGIGFLLGKLHEMGVLQKIQEFFANLWQKAKELKEELGYLSERIQADLLMKWWDLEDFLQEHKTTLTIIGGILTTIVVPALIKTGIEVGILAIKFGVNLLIALNEATLRFGLLAIEMGVNTVKSIWQLITATAAWIVEGWRMVFVIGAKIIQLGLASAAMITHVTVMGLAAIASGFLTAATWALNIAFMVLTSPIFLVILAIAAVVAIGWLLYSNWDMIGAWFLDLWNRFQIWLGEAVANMSTAINQFITNAIAWFTNLQSTASAIWNGMLEYIKQLVLGFIATVIATISQFVADVVMWFENMRAKAYNSIITMKNNVVSGIVSLWNAIVGEISSWPGKMYDWGVKMIQSFIDGIKSMVNAIGQTIKSMLNSAKGMLEGKSPPKEGPFKEIDVWGKNVGQAWVDGFQSSLSGLASVMPGSFALESNLSRGISPVAGNTGTTNNYQQPINVYAPIYTEVDMDRMAWKLGYALRNS